MKLIDQQLFDDVSQAALRAPRRRSNRNLHEKLDDPVQRLFNAIEPGTYIRPHRHGDPATWELFLMVRGSAVFLTFDDDGKVIERLHLQAGGSRMGVEIPPKTWHTIASLEPGTVFFEVKQGPYVPPQPENIASWAPAEGETAAPVFEAWFRGADRGGVPPRKAG